MIKYSREDRELDIFRRVQFYREKHSDYTPQQVSDALRKEHPGQRGFSRTNIRRFWDATEFYRRKKEKGETLTKSNKDKFLIAENNSVINKHNKDRRKSYFNLGSVNPTISKVGIATVYDDDKSILQSIWKLYLKDFDLGKSWFECDLTFSKGDFYKIGIPCPRECFDKSPVEPKGLPDPPEKVHPLELANHILEDDSISSIVIDLPQKIAINGKGSKDAFPDVKDLVKTYYELIGLAYKKLKSPTVWEPGGVLVIKVGDIDYKGQRIWLPNLVTELATGVEAGLNDPIAEEFEKYYHNHYDFILVDKFIHLYKDIAKQQNPKNRSIKAHDYFLVFSKGEKKEEAAFYYLSDKNIDEGLAGSLLLMNNYPYVSDNLAKLKKEVPAGIDFDVYKVRFKNKTLQNTISTHEKVDEGIKKALSGLKIPYEMYDNGNKLLLYLESKIKPLYQEDFDALINSKNIQIDSLEKDKFKIIERIKIYEEDGFDRKEEKARLEKIENKIKILTSDLSNLKTRIEEFSNEQNNQRERLKKTITSVSEHTLNKFRQAGVEYVEIIYNRKGNKKIIILNDESLEIELLEENIKNKHSKES